jgi:type 1 glutamine amidotransferase
VGLPVRWTRTDEWYNFRGDPRSSVHVLITLDESSMIGGEQGADHPMAWCRGRIFYTALGHTVESYSEPLFLNHLAGGLRTAAGTSPCPAR